MLAENFQKSSQVCLHVTLLCQAVQGNERRDVMATDPQFWLQVYLQVVLFQEDAPVDSCQRYTHTFTLTSLYDVKAT